MLGAVRALGLKVVVSELDIDVVQRWQWWADGGKRRKELARSFVNYLDATPLSFQLFRCDPIVFPAPWVIARCHAALH